MATRQQLKDELKQQLREESTSGAAGAYNTPFAFNPNKKAQGTSRNYYLKMGWKLVIRIKYGKQPRVWNIKIFGNKQYLFITYEKPTKSIQSYQRR
mgnify:CR=1 FL=1